MYSRLAEHHANRLPIFQNTLRDPHIDRQSRKLRFHFCRTKKWQSFTDSRNVFCLTTFIFIAALSLKYNCPDQKQPRSRDYRSEGSSSLPAPSLTTSNGCARFVDRGAFSRWRAIHSLRDLVFRGMTGSFHEFCTDHGRKKSIY